MSTVLTLTATESAIVRKDAPETNDHTSQIFGGLSGEARMYCKFAIPTEYRCNLINSVQLRACFVPYEESDPVLGSITYDVLRAYAADRPWGADITWSNKPSGYGTGSGIDLKIDAPSPGTPAYSQWGSEVGGVSRDSAWILRYGFWVAQPSLNVRTAYSTQPPEAKVEFLASKASLTPVDISPATGARITRSQDLNVTFGGKITKPDHRYYSIYDPVFADARLYYKLRGQPSYMSISVTGIDASTGAMIVPASTLPSGNVEAYIETTDSGGTVSRSEALSWDTSDTVSTALCISPAGNIVDGTEPATFVWQHINESGTLPTKSELQFSQNKKSWSGGETVMGSALSYQAQPGRFASGIWYWKVRTYNQDGVAGSWSEPAEFIVIAPPDKPKIIILDSSPRPEIQWQTNEQEGYQVQIPGIYDQILFGPVKRWRSPMYLQDGSYTIRVRSQNKYGVWSAWGIASLTIKNAPGPKIELRAQFGHNVALSWSDAGYAAYLVYRDGIPIAKTAATEYVDELSIGTPSYVVQGVIAGSGDYGSSEPVTGRICTPQPMLLALPSSAWLPLPYSLSMHSSVTKSWSRDAHYQLLQGRKYRIPELGEHLEHSLSLSCAFLLRDDPQLEKLLGRRVCLKARGDMVIGTLADIRASCSTFTISYDLTISQEQYEEEIDIDTGYILPY